MRVSKLEVRNFRAISEGEVSISPVTAILGENNSGKSSYLAALDLFFAPAPKVDFDDFHKRNHHEPIEITVHFTDLTPKELQEFGPKVENGVLIVTRRIGGGKDREYIVSGRANPAFSKIREIEKKADKIKAYKEIKDKYDLPTASKAEDCEQALTDWEAANPDKCEFTRIHGFFGAENVANGKLRQKTALIFVPAIKQVREELESKSPVKELLSGIARQAIENNKEYQDFIESSKLKIAQLTAPDSVSSLGEISAALTSIVRRYYEEAALEATWDEVSSLPINLPTPDVLVSDGVYKTRVEYVGHGMQRAIILTLLEYISSSNQKESGDFDEAQSDIVIVIEEPELFQHPTKQRLFYRALSELAKSFDQKTGIRLQVIYATHSPLLIDLPDVDRIRLVRKLIDGDEIKISVSQTTLAECANIVAPLRGFAPNPARYGAGLHVVTSDVAEAFFCKTAILVEGVSDVAILEAAFKRLGRDVLAEGIAIKSVGGKRNLDRPLLIFRQLGIPTMTIMDNDRQLAGSEKEKDEIDWNRFIQILCNIECPEEWPDLVSERLSSWEGTIEDYIRSEAGEALYNKAVSEMSKNYSVSGADCVKSPTVASALLTRLSAEGVSFEKIDRIIKNIDSQLGA